MKNTFILKAFLLGGGLFILGIIIPVFEETSVSTPWILTLVFYTLLTSLLRRWVNSTKDSSPIRFATAANGTTAVKMLLTLVIITVYLVSDQPHPAQYTFGVFTLFIAYTALFVSDTLRQIRKG